MIRIIKDKEQLGIFETVIVVPEKAIEEAGYIQVFTEKDSAHAKHEYHALAQMAYFQYQDDELALEEVDGMLTAEVPGTENIELDAGMVIARQQDGEFFVYIHRNQRKKKLLESAYRYCTRWVRLDI